MKMTAIHTLVGLSMMYSMAGAASISSAGKSMRGSGKMGRGMAKELIFIPLAIPTPANGRMMKGMEREPISIRLEKNM